MNATAHDPYFRRNSAAFLNDLSPPSSPPIHAPQQQAQARRGSTVSERRGSTASLTVPTGTEATVSQSLVDDYDYGDVGPSPEGSATKERENPHLKSNVPELRLDVSRGL